MPELQLITNTFQVSWLKVDLNELYGLVLATLDNYYRT